MRSPGVRLPHPFTFFAAPFSLPEDRPHTGAMPALDRIEHREGVGAVHPCVLRPLVELGTTPVELGTTQRRADRQPIQVSLSGRSRSVRALWQAR